MFFCWSVSIISDVFFIIFPYSYLPSVASYKFIHWKKKSHSESKGFVILSSKCRLEEGIGSNLRPDHVTLKLKTIKVVPTAAMFDERH